VMFWFHSAAVLADGIVTSMILVSLIKSFPSCFWLIADCRVLF
jgi:hypothetical protein